MSDITWGSKVEVHDLDGKIILTGNYLEYTEDTDLLWVSHEGGDHAYDAAKFTVTKLVRGKVLTTLDWVQMVDRVGKGKMPSNMLYSSNNGKTWRLAPRNMTKLDKDWEFIFVEP